MDYMPVLSSRPKNESNNRISRKYLTNRKAAASPALADSIGSGVGFGGSWGSHRVLLGLRRWCDTQKNGPRLPVK
ncbi:MAG TPA: hypothetical protein DDW52_24710 [Planctomycetaceae bacterium]|nr:hypothetical protein [Planctomycetaceae bacterium]